MNNDSIKRRIVLQKKNNNNNKKKTIRKTCLYNFDPLKHHFCIVKLGFTGVYIIFLISAQKHRLWVLVRTASLRRFYRVPTIYVLSRNMKNIRVFYLKIFKFLEVKFSLYLNRHVFVMGFLFGPQHQKMYLQNMRPVSEDSDHSRRLIKIFTGHTWDS